MCVRGRDFVCAYVSLHVRVCVCARVRVHAKWQRILAGCTAKDNIFSFHFCIRAFARALGYVPGCMSKVVSCQRIKRARSVRVDSTGPRAGKLQIPRLVGSGKSDFQRGPDSETSSVCLQCPQRSVCSLLEVPWVPFCGPRQWVCAASEKECPRTVFRGESLRASFAKTGKPYSTSFENRVWAQDAVSLPTWFQNTFILPSSSYLCGP